MSPTYHVPRVGIGLFLLSPRNTFLIGRRLGSPKSLSNTSPKSESLSPTSSQTFTSGLNTYGLPGGHLELHESFEAAAVRELYEETGIHIAEREVKFLTAANLPRYEGRHFVSLFMGARIGHGVRPKVMEPKKCAGWEWIGWDEAVRDCDKMMEVRRSTGDPTAKVPEPGRNHFEAFLSLLQQRPGFRLEDHLWGGMLCDDLRGRLSDGSHGMPKG